MNSRKRKHKHFADLGKLILKRRRVFDHPHQNKYLGLLNVSLNNHQYFYESKRAVGNK